jgi:hypothetical protein
MAYLPEDYNKGQSNGQNAGPSTGGGSQAGQPIQLSSGQASSSAQQAAPTQLNQQAPQQQTQTQTQGPKGSGMGDATKNLRQYVEQNKNVQLAQKIGQNLQGQATQVSQGIQQSGQKFQQQVAPEKQRLATAPGVVNTALDPNKSQYFAGTQQLNPEHINLTTGQNTTAAQQHYAKQLTGLDQAKQQEYQTKYQSYFQQPQNQTQDVGLDTKFGMTQQPQTLQNSTTAPQVNEQLQKDYQAWKLQQLQSGSPDKYSTYQQAIADQGKKEAEQKYYQQQFAKFGAMNPQAQLDQKYSQESDSGKYKQFLIDKAKSRSQTPWLWDPMMNRSVDEIKSAMQNDSFIANKWNPETERYEQDTALFNDPNSYASDAEKTAQRDALAQQFGVQAFDPNAYQNALLTHLDINPLTAENADLEAQNMLAAQYGLQAYDPAAYEKAQEEAQLNTRMGEMGQIAQGTPGQASTPAERLAYFQKLREGAVQQFDVQDSADLQNKIQALQTQANLGQTESGRYQLLQNVFKNPEYTTGQQRLDQLLLQQQGPQQQQLKQIQETLAKPAQKQYQDLISTAGQTNTNLAQQAKGIKSDIWKRLAGTESPTTDSSGQLITQEGGLIPELEKHIQADVTAAGEEANKATEALRSKISAGEDITEKDLKKFLPAGTTDEDVKKVLSYYNESRPDTLQDKIVNQKGLNDKDFESLADLLRAGGQTFTMDQLKRAYNTNAGDFRNKMTMQFAQNQMAGAQKRTGDWKMDFSQYLTNPDLAKYTAANIASPEEYARYNALEALAGQNPNLLKASDVGQAGTGLDQYGRFNVQQAIAKGNEVFNPATYGEMQHVNVPQAKGSTILSDLAVYPLAPIQFMSKSMGIDIPVISSISEGISGSIANLGRDLTGGRVICTELYEQGKLSRKVWEYEVMYGKYLRKYDPYVIPGYHFWAIPLVRLMKKSQVVTKIVAFCAKPWTDIKIRETTVLGKVYMKLALGTCRLIGKCLELCKGVQ